MKKLFLLLLKFGISAAIIYCLVLQAQRHHSFAALRDQPKQWWLLALAWAVATAAVSLTFVRWFLLVRAVKLPFGMKDAFRLGFLGYLFNLISVGSIGGDLFKTVFLAREQHERRVEAVASVIVDRAIGMFALLLLASIGILVSGLYVSGEVPQIEIVCRTILVAAAVGAVGVCVLLLPAVARPTLAPPSRGEVVLLGSALQRLAGALRMYRGKVWVLLLACLLSVGSQALTAVSIFAVACGLSGEHPSLAQHFFIVPLGLASGALPLPLGALGALEYVIDYLYRMAFDSEQGLVVALGYRLLTVLIAIVGASFYLASRRKVSSVRHQTQEAGHDGTRDEQQAAQLAPLHVGSASDRHAA